MNTFALAFLIGVVAGLRSMTAPAVVSWAVRLGRIHLEGTPLAFLGSAATPWIASASSRSAIGRSRPTARARRTRAS